MSRSAVKQAILLILVLLLCPAISEAQTPSVVWWVLDCSGSMWGRAPEGPKYRLAQDIIQKTMTDYPIAEYGLVAFGRREQSNCTDIELLVPPGPDGQNIIQSTLESIRPNGKSSIAASLEFIVGRIDTSKDNYLVLLSDGIEGCGGNPVAAAQKLARNKAIKAVHTILLERTGSDSLVLHTIAQAAGGAFLTASQMPHAQEWIPKSEVPAAVDTMLTPPAAPLYGKISFKIFIHSENSFPAFGTKLNVRLPDATELINKTNWKGIIEEVPPGRYFIETSNSGTTQSRQCTVKAGEMVYLPFVFDIPTGTINYQCIINGSDQIHAYNSVVHAYHESGDIVYTANRWTGSISNLPVGTYQLTAINRDYELNQEAQVSAGDSTQVVFDFPIDVGRISYQCYLDSALQKPAYGVKIKIFSLPYKEIVFDDSTRWRGQTAQIPVGEFIMSGNFFGKIINKNIEVRLNDNVQAELIFNVEQVRFSYECYRAENNPANGTDVTIYNAIGTQVESAVGWRGAFVLPAGPYSLVAQFEGQEVRKDILLVPSFSEMSAEKILFP